jgi:V/A-type H+-transporting ATPase subunit E
MNDKTAAVKVSSGVEALLQRLREDGVANGRAQAEKIVAEAESRAEWILKQAQEETEQLRNQAREEAERLQTAGHEALRVAARDAVLTLKTQLTKQFTGEVQRLVGEAAHKQELLEKLILEVAGRVQEQTATAQQMEMLLPKDVVGLEEISRDPEALEKGTLTYFVRLIGREMLREGVRFGVADDERGGLRIRLEGENIVLDVSDRAIADVLLQHLQPRFRALLEGIVK